MSSFSPTELAEWSGGVWEPCQPETIEGVSNDSRTIDRGNLYFALTGVNFDGHEFVGEAFEKGASGAVVARERVQNSGFRVQGHGEKQSPIPQSGTSRQLAPLGRGRQSAIERPLLCVDDPERALRDIASAYRLKVAPEIVAITGSVGKSTVKEMTAEMLSTAMPTARTRGNWNNNIGLPLSLLSMEDTSRVGVFEVGTNHPGEIAELCEMLKASWGVMTKIGPAHTEFFDSVEAIANEKACLLRSLPADGVAVLCPDDRFFDLFRSASPSRIITISINGDADYVCSGRDPVKSEALIEEKSTGEKFTLEIRVPGEYNVINAVFAIAVARGHGVEWEQIRAAFDSYVPLPMRWEEEKVGAIRVINDAYNANPMSMRASIQAFDEMKIEGRKWLVLAGMLELGRKEKEEHLALGEFVGSVMTGEGKGEEWGGLIVIGPLGELIAQGAESTGSGRTHAFCCKDNSEAAGAVAENITEGDAVLLKASRRMRLEEVVENLKKAGE